MRYWQKKSKIFSGGTLHTSDARQACSTDSKIALRVSGISIKHETTWNTPGLDSRNVWQSHSYFQLNMKHETAWNTPGLDSRKVGQIHSYFQSNMKLHERFLVCIQEKLDKATHIFRERVLVLQITMRGLQTPGITKTYRFFFTGPPWKWLSARP